MLSVKTQRRSDLFSLLLYHSALLVSCCLASSEHAAVAATAFAVQERVVRALRLLQQHWPEGGNLSCTWSASLVPRGDLQTSFLFKGFDEVWLHTDVLQDVSKCVTLRPIG
jgi:hypothetical protein